MSGARSRTKLKEMGALGWQPKLGLPACAVTVSSPGWVLVMDTCWPETEGLGDMVTPGLPLHKTLPPAPAAVAVTVAVTTSPAHTRLGTVP